ncbi:MULTISPECIES: histidinol-phosphate transaminase [unclassified Luteimonas]|uniref:histidinol-phosphate transaminase n=1 Tax=unclassified Luteimonas TaxID=2629088 RepID=UPI0015FFA20D|nr:MULTISPECIES: histidinol-phosphate transaminase [unclassified Luteimonas]MBB1471607.1 histidinol-phosphate transaminase [Luteimonas sp. MC1782]MBB6599654.1 histidinol-phosphate transaminase [Luteimonas sp. MC1825]QOC87343.1 histidinol-phosphate transaminase [Luteimonas sp. MC1825]
MSAAIDLLRPDLRGFAGYRSARGEVARGDVWLNANESAWPNPGDAGGGTNRYPEPQPATLRAALASLYGCEPDQLLVGRGSDEAIDLLVRALCRAGIDAVLATPPVFGMYAVSARLQGAPLIEVPLRDADAGFELDADALVAAAVQGNARIVFLCSPSNPTGGAIPLALVADIAARLAGRALVVVDEAYAEFDTQASATTLLASCANLAVLRTLSKAHALAAARIGCVIADADLIAALRACQAPYPVPAPCAALALAALAPDALATTRARVDLVVAERERMRLALAGLPGVRRVYPSAGNFLLLRFADAGAALAALQAAGVVVRDQRAVAGLDDALRITIGTAAENDRVLAALGAAGSTP